MSRIVYVWELGAGYGHIASFHAIAKQLQLHGHEVIFVAKNLEHIDSLLGQDQFQYLQAPVNWPTSLPTPAALSYPGIMKNTGFTETGAMLARAKAWRSLYELLSPDLLLFDHAPTALLAARGLNIPKALFGSGFTVPPQTTPLPSLRPWLKVATGELMQTEIPVLNAANAVLHRLDTQPLDNLADLFQADEHFLCTFAELDPCPQRLNQRYWGPTLYISGGLEPRWPLVGNGKVFAYLHRDYPGMETLLQQLHATHHAVLVHIAGITPAFIQKYSAANLHISPHPFNMAAVCQQSDMAISYGGAGTVAAFLLAGKPLLVLPDHLERLLNAHTAIAMGTGLFVAPETKKPNYRALVNELLSNPKYRLAAEAFANRHADFNPDRQAAEIADRCEKLIAEHGRN